MSEFALVSVLQNKTCKIVDDIAKINKKSDKATPFVGFFFTREGFSPVCGFVYRQSARRVPRNKASQKPPE